MQLGGGKLQNYTSGAQPGKREAPEFAGIENLPNVWLKQCAQKIGHSDLFLFKLRT